MANTTTILNHLAQTYDRCHRSALHWIRPTGPITEADETRAHNDAVHNTINSLWTADPVDGWHIATADTTATPATAILWHGDDQYDLAQDRAGRFVITPVETPTPTQLEGAF